MFSQLTAFAAFKLFTFSELAFPIYLFIINIALVLIIKKDVLIAHRTG
jgi:hypothetical protein